MITGVADERRPRIGDQGHALALLDAGDQHIRLLLLVVIVQGKGRYRDLVVAEQDPGMPGILGNHQIDAAQHVQCSLGDIGRLPIGWGLYTGLGCHSWEFGGPDNCVAILARLHLMENFNTGRGNELEPGYKTAKCITTLRHPIAAVLLAACASEPNQSSGQPGIPSASRIGPRMPSGIWSRWIPPNRQRPRVADDGGAQLSALGQAKPAAALYQRLQKQAKSGQQAQLQLLQAHLLLAQATPTRR